MTANGTTILVGTTKGAFLIDGSPDRRSWRVRGPFCDGWPINHVIGDPATGTIWAGGGGDWNGAGVWRSEDGGESWTVARLGEDRGPWAWRMWQSEIELAAGAREILARAFDSAGQTQPSDVGQVWNFKGYMNNAWARVAVEATPA